MHTHVRNTLQQFIIQKLRLHIIVKFLNLRNYVTCSKNLYQLCIATQDSGNPIV